MKLLLPPAAMFLLSASTSDAVALRFAPEEGTVLKRVFEARAEYHLADFTQTVNGEALERDGDLPEINTGFVEHIAVTDKLGAVQDQRPSELVRTFDELSQEDSGGKESRTLVSPLQGRKVRFTWDGDDKRYHAEAADDDELDESLAQWLAEDMDLRLLLPGKEVEVGDEWELDPKLYLAFMWPSGLLDFHLEGEESGADEFSRETIERLAGSGTARLAELREEDGVHLAAIHVELQIDTGSDRDMPAIEQDGEVLQPELTLEIAIERKLEGTILWDLDHGHARSAELECEATRKETSSGTVTFEQEDGEEGSADLQEIYLYEGKIHYSATIERQ